MDRIILGDLPAIVILGTASLDMPGKLLKCEADPTACL